MAKFFPMFRGFSSSRKHSPWVWKKVIPDDATPPPEIISISSDSSVSPISLDNHSPSPSDSLNRRRVISIKTTASTSPSPHASGTADRPASRTLSRPVAKRRQSALTQQKRDSLAAKILESYAEPVTRPGISSPVKMDPIEDKQERKKRLAREAQKRHRDRAQEVREAEVAAADAQRRVQDMAAQTAGRGRGSRGTSRGRTVARGGRRVVTNGGRKEGVEGAEHSADPAPNIDIEDDSLQEFSGDSPFGSIDPSLTQQVAVRQVVTSTYVPKFANDLGAGRGDPSAEDIILDWMSQEGNVAKLKTSDAIGKRALTKDINENLAKHGMVVRTAESLVDKVSLVVFWLP